MTTFESPPLEIFFFGGGGWLVFFYQELQQKKVSIRICLYNIDKGLKVKYIMYYIQTGSLSIFL